VDIVTPGRCPASLPAPRPPCEAPRRPPAFGSEFGYRRGLWRGVKVAEVVDTIPNAREEMDKLRAQLLELWAAPQLDSERARKILQRMAVILRA
jgi:hypothetical protein